MAKLVSITKQGQVTIPQEIRKAFGIRGATKAVVQKLGDTIVVKPKPSFWELSGSLKSDKTLNDKELKVARESFGKKWPRKQ